MSIKLRKKKLKDGSTSLYLDSYVNGKRKYEFLKLYLVKPKTDLDRQQNKEALLLAENIRAKRQSDNSHAQHGFVAQFKNQASVIEFLKVILKEQKVDNSRGHWSNMIACVKRYTKRDDLTFADITEAWLWQFRAYLIDTYAQNTAYGYLNKMVTALNRAKREKIIFENPADRVDRIPQVEGQREYLTLEELQRLAQAKCDRPDLKKAFLFSALTGIRHIDLFKMKWKQIQHSSAMGDYVQFVQTKTKKAEQLPLSKQARALLGPAGDPEENVFTNIRRSSWVSDKLTIWMLRAGIDKPITFHCARHTFATLAITSDIDLYTVSKMLGHKRIETTQIYAKVIDKKKVDAVNKMPEINFGGIENE